MRRHAALERASEHQTFWMHVRCQPGRPVAPVSDEDYDSGDERYRRPNRDTDARDQRPTLARARIRITRDPRAAHALAVDSEQPGPRGAGHDARAD